MIHDFTGLVHTTSAFAAMAVGAIIFLRPKRGTFHRSLGYIYCVSMAVVIGTSFAIYRLTGTFNALHGAAIAGCVSVGFGFAHALLRRPRGQWYVWHYYWMSWSFIGLLAAFVAELSTRVAMPIIVARSRPHAHFS